MQNGKAILYTVNRYVLADKYGTSVRLHLGRYERTSVCIVEGRYNVEAFTSDWIAVKPMVSSFEAYETKVTVTLT